MEKLIELIKKNDCYVITNNLVKRKILSNINEVIDVTFKNDKEACNDLVGYYEKIVIYLIKHFYNVTYDRALKIFDSLLIAKERNDIDPKLDKIISPFYHAPIKYNKNIIVIGKVSPLLYRKLNNEYKDNVIFYKKDSVNNIKAYEYTSIIYEVEALANRLCKIIKENGNKVYDDICVYYNDEQYVDVIKEVFPFYNLSYSISESTSLYAIPAIRKFVDELDLNNIDVETIKDNELKSKVISILNELVLIDFNKDDLIDELKNQTISNKSKGIRFEKYGNFNSFYKYSFILGLAFNVIPSIHKDDGIYNDEMLDSMGILTSSKQNVIEKEFFNETISSIDNIVISFAKSGISSDFVKSDLVDNFESDDIDYSSSKERCKLQYAKTYQRKKLFNDIDKMYKAYEKEFKNVEIYNPEFKGVDKETLKSLLVKSETKEDGSEKYYMPLSYSKLSEFLKCPYGYFAKYVLKVPEDSFENTSTGDVIHLYLEKHLQDENYTLEDAISEYNNGLVRNNSPHRYYLAPIYLEKFKKYLDELLKVIENVKKAYGFDLERYEDNITISIGKDPSIRLTGKIDKQDRNSNEDKVFIFDYKSSNYKKSFELNDGTISNELTEKQIEALQLFTYLKLLNVDYEHFGGVCYQRVLPKKKKEESEKAFYNPYGLANETTLADKSISFTAISKLSYEEALDNLEKIILEYQKRVLEGRFDIDPIEEGCKYCKMKKLCFIKIEKNGGE